MLGDFDQKNRREKMLQLDLDLKVKMSPEEKIEYLEERIEQMTTSLEKVRKNLFAKISDLHKLCSKVVEENEELKTHLSRAGYENTEWLYNQNGLLFEKRGATGECGSG